MKVTKVEALPVHPGWRKNIIFVRVETDSGIVGWGEAYSQYDRDSAICAQIQELARYLPGRDPFQIRHFLQVAFDDYSQRRGSLEYYCAISGIEQALWDIVGKATDQPVYNLLGGPVRKKIRVYANGWSYKMEDPDSYARAAEEAVAKGYTALKLDPLPRPWRTHIPKDHIRHAVTVVRSIRDAVGPSVDILLDIHRRLAPVHAIDLAKALEEFEPYWFEEPCQIENVDALRDVREATRIPVVTGEAAYTRHGLREVLRKRAVDYINPDVANCGGILELILMAAAAETEAVGVSPHNYNSTTLALAATMHASAVMPNFLITEYFLPFEKFGRTLVRNAPTVVDGYIELSDAPGLGLDIDEDAVRRCAAKPYPARELRRPEHEGP